MDLSTKLQDIETCSELNLFIEEIIQSENLPSWNLETATIESWIDKAKNEEDVQTLNALTQLCIRYVPFREDDAEQDSIIDIFFKLNSLVSSINNYPCPFEWTYQMFWESITEFQMIILRSYPSKLHCYVIDLGKILLKTTMKSSLPIFVRQLRIKSLNHLLEDCPTEIRIAFKEETQSKFPLLLTMLGDVGDYDYQTSIVETIFRLTLPQERSDNIAQWLPGLTNSIRTTFLNISDFDPDCRKFLNAYNKSVGSKCQVVSINALSASIGTYELRKPNLLSYEHLWIDFNLGSKTVSLLFDHGNPEVPTQERSWETIMVYSNEVNRAILQLAAEICILKLYLNKNPSLFFASPIRASIVKHLSSEFCMQFPFHDQLEALCFSLFESRLKVSHISEETVGRMSTTGKKIIIGVEDDSPVLKAVTDKKESEPILNIFHNSSDISEAEFIPSSANENRQENKSGWSITGKEEATVASELLNDTTRRAIKKDETKYKKSRNNSSSRSNKGKRSGKEPQKPKKTKETPVRQPGLHYVDRRDLRSQSSPPKIRKYSQANITNMTKSSNTIDLVVEKEPTLKGNNELSEIGKNISHIDGGTKRDYNEISIHEMSDVTQQINETEDSNSVGINRQCSQLEGNSLRHTENLAYDTTLHRDSEPLKSCEEKYESLPCVENPSFQLKLNVSAPYYSQLLNEGGSADVNLETLDNDDATNLPDGELNVCNEVNEIAYSKLTLDRLFNVSPELIELEEHPMVSVTCPVSQFDNADQVELIVDENCEETSAEDRILPVELSRDESLVDIKGDNRTHSVNSTIADPVQDQNVVDVSKDEPIAVKLCTPLMTTLEILSKYPAHTNEPKTPPGKSIAQRMASSTSSKYRKDIVPYFDTPKSERKPSNVKSRKSLFNSNSGILLDKQPYAEDIQVISLDAGKDGSKISEIEPNQVMPTVKARKKKTPREITSKPVERQRKPVKKRKKPVKGRKKEANVSFSSDSTLDTRNAYKKPKFIKRSDVFLNNKCSTPKLSGQQDTNLFQEENNLKLSKVSIYSDFSCDEDDNLTWLNGIVRPGSRMERSIRPMTSRTYTRKNSVKCNLRPIGKKIDSGAKTSPKGVKKSADVMSSSEDQKSDRIVTRSVAKKLAQNSSKSFTPHSIVSLVSRHSPEVLRDKSLTNFNSVDERLSFDGNFSLVPSVRSKKRISNEPYVDRSKDSNMSIDNPDADFFTEEPANNVARNDDNVYQSSDSTTSLISNLVYTDPKEGDLMTESLLCMAERNVIQRQMEVPKCSDLFGQAPRIRYIKEPQSSYCEQPVENLLKTVAYSPCLNDDLPSALNFSNSLDHTQPGRSADRSSHFGKLSSDAECQPTGNTDTLTTTDLSAYKSLSKDYSSFLPLSLTEGSASVPGAENEAQVKCVKTALAKSKPADRGQATPLRQKEFKTPHIHQRRLFSPNLQIDNETGVSSLVRLLLDEVSIIRRQGQELDKRCELISEIIVSLFAAHTTP